MNILFLTIGSFNSIHLNGVYTDLLRSFYNQGHSIYIVSQVERRKKERTTFSVESNIFRLNVKTGNITKVGIAEKGISTILLPYQYLIAINKYFREVDFDIVLYSTPPITLYRVIKSIKKKTNAFAYLMLKDIFPQNAVDLKLFPQNLIGKLMITYFSLTERKFYEISDKIGCMSKANVDFLRKNQPQLPISKIEICPNTIDSIERPIVKRNEILAQYNIPNDKQLLIYGGNIGKPQNVNYIISVIEHSQNYEAFHFIICGNGTDFYRIQDLKAKFYELQLTVINSLSFVEYTKLLSCCDAGLIFLDYRFTIPNFPSRMLDYLNNSLAVIAATDDVTDIKDAIHEGDFGWWCSSRSVEGFISIIDSLEALGSARHQVFEDKGTNAKQYLLSNYSTNIANETILKSFKEWESNNVH
jgi:hypothetical protein